MNKREFLMASGAAVASAGLGACATMTTSQDALPPAFAPVHDHMAAQVKPDALPGAVWLVAQGDDVVVDAVGMQTIGGSAPMRRDAIFRIASMTKAITAACVLMLVEEGKLSLDAPAERWLPELANRRVLKRLDGPIDDTVPAARAITVKDLLTFTFGFGLVFDNNLPIQKRIDELQLVNGMPIPMTPHVPDEWMRRFGTLPLMHQPGEKWMYNTGSLIQGVLVRRASGQSFGTFLAERITGPLGMRDTAFYVPAAKLDRFAGCGAFTDPQTHQVIRMDRDGAESGYATPPVFPSGAGGLCSTVDDYLVFARMLMNGGAHGGRTILRTETVREMTRDQITPAVKAASATTFFPGFFDASGWGYGVGISTAPDAVSQVPGRYGWDGGFGTSFTNDPSRGLIAIVMTQSSDFLFNGQKDAFFRSVYVATATRG